MKPVSIRRGPPGLVPILCGMVYVGYFSRREGYVACFLSVFLDTLVDVKVGFFC